MRQRTAISTIGIVLLAAMAGVLIVGMCGCDVYTSKTVNQMDDNATYSRNIANQANAGQLSQAQEAYYLECFARGYENLSAAGHWKQPPFVAAPTTMPTTLPWTPAGGENPAIKP